MNTIYILADLKWYPNSPRYLSLSVLIGIGRLFSENSWCLLFQFWDVFTTFFSDLVNQTIKSKKDEWYVLFGAESLYHEEDVIKEMEVKEATFIVQIRSKNNNFFFYFPLSFYVRASTLLASYFHQHYSILSYGYYIWDGVYTCYENVWEVGSQSELWYL